MLIFGCSQCSAVQIGYSRMLNYQSGPRVVDLLQLRQCELSLTCDVQLAHFAKSERFLSMGA